MSSEDVLRKPSSPLWEKIEEMPGLGPYLAGYHVQLVVTVILFLFALVRLLKKKDKDVKRFRKPLLYLGRIDQNIHAFALGDELIVADPERALSQSVQLPLAPDRVLQGFEPIMAKAKQNASYYATDTIHRCGLYHPGTLLLMRVVQQARHDICLGQHAQSAMRTLATVDLAASGQCNLTFDGMPPPRVRSLSVLWCLRTLRAKLARLFVPRVPISKPCVEQSHSSLSGVPHDSREEVLDDAQASNNYAPSLTGCDDVVSPVCDQEPSQDLDASAPKRAPKRPKVVTPQAVDDVLYDDVQRRPSPSCTGDLTHVPVPDLPCTKHYALIPHATRLRFYDRHAQSNYLDAFRYRVMATPPPCKPIPESGLIDETVDWLRQLMPGAPYSVSLDEVTVIGWLNSRPYTCVRKEQIREAIQPFLRGGEIDVRSALKKSRIKAFIKDESYPIPDDGPEKPPRLICARDDIGKAIYGPIFEPLNRELFRIHYCTKHVPWKDRPHFIDEWLIRPGWVYVSIDYSSYESCQRAKLMRLLEKPFYTSCLRGKDVEYCLENLTRPQVVNTDHDVGVRLYTPALRFSGEMNTSLGNTCNNILMIASSLRDLGYEFSDIRFVCEGDDALIGLAPTDVEALSRRLESYGMRLKSEVFERPGDAGYCHQWWTASGEIITDIKHRLRQLLWASSPVRAADQLAARGTSLLYDYPHCPILTAIGLKLQDYSDVSMVFGTNSWMIEQFEVDHRIVRQHNGWTQVDQIHPTDVSVTDESRAFVASHFDIPIEDQIRIEKLDLASALQALGLTE